MTERPSVSVIIPAFQAKSTIATAARSVASAGLSRHEVEIVVASDDGTDYSSLLSHTPNARFAPTGPVKSGPGAARNRALEIATGQYIAFLDADDTWEPGYLSTLLPLAQARGAAFATTVACRGGKEVLRLSDADKLTLEHVGQSGASFFPVARRDLVGRFAHEKSQDTFQTVEILSLVGGSAPLGPVDYRLTLHSDSTTRATGFAEALQTDYRHYHDRILKGQSRVPNDLMERAAQVFTDRIALNAEYMLQDRDISFYDFLAKRTARSRSRLAA